MHSESWALFYSFSFRLILCQLEADVTVTDLSTLIPQLSTVKLIGSARESGLVWVHFVCETCHALNLWLQAICIITTFLNIDCQNRKIT